MPSYRVSEDGSLIDKETGKRFVPNPKVICAPRIQSDIPDYISPVTGKPVSGAAQRREDLKRSGCIDARELGESFGKRRGVQTEKYSKRLGLPLIGRDI